MIQVIKRDGEIAEFNLSKITEAIKKAFRATNKDYTEELLQLLSLRVTADFQAKMKDGKMYENYDLIYIVKPPEQKKSA